MTLGYTRGRQTKHDIDARALAIFLWLLAKLNAVSMDQQMTVRRGYIDMASLNRTPLHWKPNEMCAVSSLCAMPLASSVMESLLNCRAHARVTLVVENRTRGS